MPDIKREDIAAICDWFENPNHIKYECQECTNQDNAMSIIRAMAAYDPWPDDGTLELAKLRIIIKEITSFEFETSTLDKHAVDVRKLFLAACREMHLPQDLYVESYKKEQAFRVSWVEADGRYNENVFFVTVNWHDEYIDEIIRGFVVMGETLGFIPGIIRVAAKDDIPKAVLDLINAYRGRSLSLAMPLAAVGEVGDWLDEEITKIDINKRSMNQIIREYNMIVPITEVGYDQAAVKQNNRQMGIILGDCVVADAAKIGRESGTVVVIGTAEQGTGDPYARRRKHFRQQVTKQFNVLETAKVPRDELFGLAASQTAERILTELLRDGQNYPDIFAVYCHTTTMLNGVLNALRICDKINNINVYVDYLSSYVLKNLADPASPVKATICVDPFHYGRLVFRVAVSRRAEIERDLCEPIAPTILTEEDVRERTIPHACGVRHAGFCYMSELPFLFPDRDICLEDPKDYAWPDWMKKRLGDMYGPRLREKRQRLLTLKAE